MNFLGILQLHIREIETRRIIEIQGPDLGVLKRDDHQEGIVMTLPQGILQILNRKYINLNDYSQGLVMIGVCRCPCRNPKHKEHR